MSARDGKSRRSNSMRIAAYQFGVSGDIDKNFGRIKKAVNEAADLKLDLIIFPECALTGYPHRDFPDTAALDYENISLRLEEIKALSDRYDINILIGTVASDEKIYNRAYLFSPKKSARFYDKRALYGWDEENFTVGTETGIFNVKGMTIGVRICFEVRFPEYFRELYKAQTDLNVVLFNDVSEEDDYKRYDLIKCHLITRAVENVTPILSVNSVSPYQTAPSCFIDASGNVLAEYERNTEGMLIYDFEKKELNFGELGRKKVSDSLLEI